MPSLGATVPDFLRLSFVLPKVGIQDVPSSQAGRAQRRSGAPQVALEHVGEAAAARAERRRAGLGARPDPCGDCAGGTQALRARCLPGPVRPRRGRKWGPCSGDLGECAAALGRPPWRPRAVGLELRGGDDLRGTVVRRRAGWAVAALGREDALRM